MCRNVASPTVTEHRFVKDAQMVGMIITEGTSNVCTITDTNIFSRRPVFNLKFLENIKNLLLMFLGCEHYEDTPYNL